MWVRDIRQVIDDAIGRAQPTDGKVTLLGYSLGANRVGRTLYAANPVLPGSAATVAKVNRVVFGVPLVTERFWSLRVGAASGQLDRDDRDPVF